MRIVAALAVACTAISAAADLPAREDARRLLFSGQHEQAAARYRALLDADAGWAEGYDGLVRALLAAKNAPEACRVLAGAPSNLINTAPLQTAAGRVMFRRGQLRVASNLFDVAAKLDPRYAGAVSGLARLALCTSRFQTAARLAAQAHQLAPDDPETIEVWAETLQDRGERVKALDRLLAIYAPGSTPAVRVAREVAVQKALGDRRTEVLESPYQRYELKLARLSGGLAAGSGVPRHRAVRTQLNGGREVRLRLDTRAGRIIVGGGVAAKAKLERLSEQEHLARNVSMSGLAFANVLAGVAELDGEDGRISSGLFEPFLVTIDFPRLILALDPFPGETAPAVAGTTEAVRPAAPGFTELIRFGDRLLAPVSLNGAAPAWFVIDSSMPFNVIHDSGALPNSAVVAGSGPPGERVELGLGALKLKSARAVRMNLAWYGDVLGTEVAGILGMPILSDLKVTIDYRNGAIAFQESRP